MIALCLEPDQLAGKFEPPVVAKFTFMRISIGSAVGSQIFEVKTLETAIDVAVVEGHSLKRVLVYANIFIGKVERIDILGTKVQNFFEPGLVFISDPELEIKASNWMLDRHSPEVVALIADALFLDGLPCPKHGSDD